MDKLYVSKARKFPRLTDIIDAISRIAATIVRRKAQSCPVIFYVPSHGTYVLSYGIYVPRDGMEKITGSSATGNVMRTARK